jgi:NTP pyrophosphatase (non-canonical NTP hydrolase)
MSTDQSSDGVARKGNAEIQIDNWRRKAVENREEWGEQSVETLLLAMQEELGELSQATLEYRDEDGYYGPIFEELDDLGALLIQFCWAANAHRIQGGEA